MNNFLELKNIKKNFITEKTIKVLRGLSKKFKSGKIYAVMGPSGSGKSTLLNLISLIDRPTSGSILIENKTINFNDTNKNDILRAKKIGIIYQQDNLLTDFTSLELLKSYLKHPLMTFKIISAIHFEAIKLWAKGIKFIKKKLKIKNNITFEN